MTAKLVVYGFLVAWVALGISGVCWREDKVRRRWALASILVGGASLRLYHPGELSLWLDELGTAWVVNVGTLEELRRRVFDSVPQSSAYYAIVYAVTRWFGMSETTLRAASVVAGIASLPAMYLMVRTLCPRRRDVALASVLLLSLAAQPLNFSLDARPYALAGLLAILATTAWIRAVRSGAWRDGIAYAALAAATVYVHWLSAIYVAAQAVVGLALLLLYDRSRGRVLRYVGFLAVCSLGVLPLLPKFLHDLAMADSLDWMRRVDEAVRSQLFRESLFDPLVAGTLVLSGIALAFRRLRGAPTPLSEEDRWALTVLAGVYACSLSLAAVALFAFGRFLFVPRYLSFLAVVTIPLAALLLGALPGRRVRLVILLAVLGPGVLTHHVPVLRDLGTFKSNGAEQRWREGIATLDENWREGDLVILRSGFIEEDLVALTGSAPARAFVQAPLSGFYNRVNYGEVISLTKEWNPEAFAGHLSAVKAEIVERWRRERRAMVFGLDTRARGIGYFQALRSYLEEGLPPASVTVLRRGSIALMILAPRSNAGGLGEAGP